MARTTNARRPDIAAPLTDDEVRLGIMKVNDRLQQAGLLTKVADTELKLALGGTQLWVDPADGRSYYLAALQLAGGSQAREAFQAAVKATSMDALIEKLRNGWTERSSSGRVQHILALPVDSANDTTAATLWALPARSAVLKADGRPVATLVLKGLPVAPSRSKGDDWALVDGDAGTPTVLDATEFIGLGVLLDTMSAVSSPSNPYPFDARANSNRVRAARDYTNRRTTQTRLVSTLAAAGYTVSGLDGPDEPRHITAPNDTEPFAVLGPRGLTADTLQLLDGRSDTQFKPGVLYRAFDIIATLDHDGDIVEAADQLIASGESVVEQEQFQAATIREIDLDQATKPLVQDILNAIAAATNRANPGVPLAMQRTMAGVVFSIVSVTPDGSLRTWTNDTVDELIQGAVQLVSYYPKEPGMPQKVRAYRHEVPRAVRNNVWHALMSRGSLPEVRYIGTEPILTGAGVISEHGYHGREKALIAIPLHERRMWSTRFTVPAEPTLADAQASFDYLCLELFSDVPYLGHGDQARHLALLLTSVARPFLDQAPFFMLTATKPGTGKGLGCEICRRVAVGSPEYVDLLGGKQNENEDRQALTSATLENKRFVHCDEAGAFAAGGWFTSMAVTKAVTSLDGAASARKLGGNETARIAGLVITATGNNIAPGGDLPRRTLQIRLDAGRGIRPAERTEFRHPAIYRWIEQNRPELLAHVFTVLTYGVQHPVEGLKSYGFTGNWSQVVLGSLHHVTLDGTNAHLLAMDRFQEQLDSDRDSEEWGPLFAKLFELSAGQRFEAQDARRWAHAHQTPLPFVLRTENIGGRDASTHNTAWTNRFKNQRGVMTFGEHRYEIELVEKSSKSATQQYIVHQYTTTGQELEPIGAQADRITSEYLRGETWTAKSATPHPAVPAAQHSPVQTAVAADDDRWVF